MNADRTDARNTVSGSGCRIVSGPSVQDVGRWLDANGLPPAFLRRIGVEVHADGGRTVLTFPEVGDGCTGSEPVVVGLTPSARDGFELIGFGSVEGARSLWSSKAVLDDHVIVVPDLLLYWLVLRTLDDAGIHSPLILTSTHPGNVPAEWEEEAFWSSRSSVTLVTDSLSGDDPVRQLLSAVVSNPLEAEAPGSATWFDVLASCARPSSSRLRDILSGAPRMRDLGGSGRCAPTRRRAAAPTDLHMLDERGRLRRVVLVEEAWVDERRRLQGLEADHRYRRMVVRSDRSIHSVAEVPAPAGTSPEDRVVTLDDGSRLHSVPCAGSETAWTFDSVIEYLAGGDDGDLPELADIFAVVAAEFAELGGEVSQMIGAYVILTYVYQAFEEIPVLWLHAPPSRSRTLLTGKLGALCHAGLAVSRGNGRYVELAQETGGTLIFDEPGRVTTPAGLTDLGCHLRAACFRDGPSERVVGSRKLRPLRRFGPRVVVSTRPCPDDLADVCVSPKLDLQRALACRPSSSAQSVVNDLYSWSMGAVNLIAAAKPSDVYKGARAPLDAIVTAAGLMPSAASEEGTGRLDPAGLLAAALTDLRVAGVGRHLSITQLTLEATLLNGGPVPFAAEQIGRWMVENGGVDPDATVVRRRLHGHIARIYTLAEGAPDGDMEDAFRFCSAECGNCPYDLICEGAVPGLKAAKLARRFKS